MSQPEVIQLIYLYAVMLIVKAQRYLSILQLMLQVWVARYRLIRLFAAEILLLIFPFLVLQEIFSGNLRRMVQPGMIFPEQPVQF